MPQFVRGGQQCLSLSGEANSASVCQGRPTVPPFGDVHHLFVNRRPWIDPDTLRLHVKTKVAVPNES